MTGGSGGRFKWDLLLPVAFIPHSLQLYIMTLLELKKSIHAKIDSLNDERYLEMINDIISSKDEVFIVPEHMKEGIREGQEDIRNGNFTTMEELEKKYEKWLKE